ncbi:hypothetical protein SAMN05216188_11859 [Lentzea xinjiangensis]|uniref:Scaffolding protein n=1 Tax=Lentzea xinjiangensis TaxID=402600 RepID=A0A1H9TE10_9PSEU|nr:hypothetical protein [Lentzea xinjiangensis]SER95348.1 hypothetical protein SAMN05216188_11859 [Lentzea xinjiangensis]
MSNPAAPQGAPAATPPAPVAPEGGQPPAAATPPAPTPPASTPAPQGTPPAQPPAGQPGGEKTFTQADLDRIIGERLEKQQKALQSQQSEQMKKLAEAMGWQNPEGAPDPAKLLEQAQQQANAYQQQAQSAMAEALAAQAGIRPERVGTFAKLVDLAGALKDVDPTSGDAVRTAIKSAVDAKAAEFPEWKGAVLPGSSGGDGQGGATPSLDERIAAATKAGNHALAISLQRQKAREQAGR